MIARRPFSSASSSKSTSKWLLWIGVPAIVGGAGYYYSTLPRRAEPKAYIPAFDGQWKDFDVIKVVKNTHNVSTIKFRLPEGATDVGLPVASFVTTKFTPSGEEKAVIRPYTPIEPDTANGTFDLVVKAYPNGKMSQHITNLKEGDKLSMKGPILKYLYEPNKEKHIGLIAGGSGITPMFQLLQKVANDPSDKTKVDLIFANVEEKDIFLKDKLDALASKKPDQIKIHYSLDKPPKGWTGPSGFINEALLKKLMPSPGAGKVFICGPPPMVAAIAGPKAKDYTQGELSGLLKNLGYSSENVFKF